MCLAKAYIADAAVPAVQTGTAADEATGPGAHPDDSGLTLVMENVTLVDVQGDTIQLRSLFGGTEVLRARIVSVDFADGRLMLEGVDGRST